MGDTPFNQVVLVDRDDSHIGLMDKVGAHKNPGVLHRAISVVLYRSIPGSVVGAVRSRDQVEILLQRRSVKKPLWPLHWADTCSTHPFPGESYEACAVRRLHEEMGITVDGDDVRLLFKQYYQADYSQELSEHEVNGILVCTYDGSVFPNPDEVAETVWVPLSQVLDEVKNSPTQYAAWFVLLMRDERLLKELL